MAVKSQGRQRKQPWSLWTERRVPSEYEAVTYKFHNHFRNEPAPHAPGLRLLKILSTAN